MKRWFLPFLLLVIAVIAGWHATLAVTTFGIMEGAIRRIAAGGAPNTMRHGQLSTPANQPIVRPSPDLAYSSCAFDLSEGPLLITYVPVPGRYSSLSIFDARTDAVFVRNDQQAGGKPVRVVVARKGQSVPGGVETVRVDYDRGIALVRLLLAEPGEIAQLDPLRRQSTCATFSS